MSNLLFENEVKQLMRMGIHRDLAILTASAKLEDKSIFHQALKKLKDENLLIEQELIKAGFISSNDIDDSDKKQEIKSWLDGGDKE